MDHQILNASPIPLEWRGKVYRVGLLKQKAQGDIVAAAKNAALTEHFGRRAFMPEDLWADEYHKLKKADFSLTSANFKEFLESWQGAVTFLSVLLNVGGTPLSDDDIGDLMLEEPQAVAAVLSQVWELSFPPKALARVAAKP